MELLVVFCIIGLLLYVAVPRLPFNRGAHSLPSVARACADSLRLAREQAITRAAPADLVLNVAGRMLAGDTADETCRLPEGIAISADVPDGQRLAGDGARIRFFPDGSSTGAAIRLQDAGGRIAILVDWLTGKVSLHDG